MTIRGGGNPRTHMVFEPQSRMGPPPPELRHRCAWLHHGQIHWEIYRIQVCRATLRAWLGELASDICRRLLTPAGNGGSPDPAKPAAVLVTVKDKSLRDGAGWGPSPSLTVTARGGQRQTQVGTRRWSPTGRTRR